MNRRIPLTAVVLASALLGGCATYDYVGNTAPGGYYHGRPTVEYYDAYGGGVYGGYYSGPYRYRGAYGYPYYGHYGPYYPYYRPHYHPRPPRPGHGDDRPKPPPTGGGDRPPPWRDPTGVYRDSGSQPMIPHRPNRVTPAPSQPRVRSEGYRPERVMSSPAMPRASERPPSMQRSAPPRAERPAPASRPASMPRGRLPSQPRQQEP